jgi:arylsulfatase A-like enzyme
MSSEGRATPTTLLVALLCLVLSGCGGCGDTTPPLRLVVITLDTLRYDGLHPEEGDKTTMPTTLALAEHGFRSTAFHTTSSSTQPTHASLFTGSFPWEHGVTRNGLVLGDQETTLAEILHEAGFETRAVVASFPLERHFGFAQGFDDYCDTFDERATTGQWNAFPVEDQRFHSFADRVADRAVASIDAARAPRQLFWFHFFDPHAPYGDASSGSEVIGLPSLLRLASTNAPETEERIRAARELYDRDVRHLDACLARVFTRLEQDRSRIPTFIVITSDHGESFGEDGSLGHGRRVSRPQVHVPLVIVGPGIAPRVEARAASSVDVATTLLELAFPGSGRTLGHGRNLLARVPSPSQVWGMRRTYDDEPQDLRRKDGTWRIVELVENEFFVLRDGKLWAGDEGAAWNDDDGSPAPAGIAEDLKALFGHFARSLEGAVAVESLDARTRKALEDLGYLEAGEREQEHGHEEERGN